MRVEGQSSERLVAVGTGAAGAELVENRFSPRPMAALWWADFKDCSFVKARAASQRGAVEVSVRIADYAGLGTLAVGAGWALRAEAVENGIRPGTTAVGSQLIDGAIIVRAADQRCALKIALRVGDESSARVGSVRAARKNAKAVDRRVGVLGMRSLWPKRHHNCGEKDEPRGDASQRDRGVTLATDPFCRRHLAEETLGYRKNSSIVIGHANSKTLESNPYNGPGPESDPHRFGTEQSV
jgi:hypothetical protein